MEAVAVRQAEVKDNQLSLGISFGKLQSVVGGTRLVDDGIRCDLRQDGAERVANKGMVIDKKDFHGRA
jgi:hypothetical protein